ncbi:hypothetical protein PX699_08260 [Sphingobium sp. H39-3-25]|uniref:hypothetical protein n=1 Tax=Sphingobium arseniciresistens TaxID=3030834 RepID=UPI0023BA399A|nr:hypothetical protein [Sphingobium arseniciresistens]
MIDDHSTSAAGPDTSQDKPAERRAEARAAEAAAIRRRWITLGEVLAVVAVVISGLTLWNSWTDRRETAAREAAEKLHASDKAAILVLTATPAARGRSLAIAPTSAGQTIQSQTIRFPADLKLAPVNTAGDARIEADWFEEALKDARDRAGMPDDSRGDERLPVAIETLFVIGGDTYRDTALYDIGYAVKGRTFIGHRVTLSGLSLVQHTPAAKAQARVNMRWLRGLPPVRE